MMNAILMAGKIGTTELLVVLIILLILFGPKYLPKLGQTLGNTLRGFKEGLGGDEDANSNVTASTGNNANTTTNDNNGKTEA